MRNIILLDIIFINYSSMIQLCHNIEKIKKKYIILYETTLNLQHLKK